MSKQLNNWTRGKERERVREKMIQFRNEGEKKRKQKNEWNECHREDFMMEFQLAVNVKGKSIYDIYTKEFFEHSNDVGYILSLVFSIPGNAKLQNNKNKSSVSDVICLYCFLIECSNQIACKCTIKPSSMISV